VRREPCVVSEAFRIEKLSITQYAFQYMILRLIALQLILASAGYSLSAQVRIRIFADKSTVSAVFSPLRGEYLLDIYDEKPFILKTGEPVILERYDGKIAVKVRDTHSFICDSLELKGLTGKDEFSLRNNGPQPVKQRYAGDLQCYPDFGKIVFVNTCEIEKYIAGVVKAEGGSGRYIEYIKTQALLARTYMYKYFHRHDLDSYNLCDNTHCQAFNGITTDSMIIRAAFETKGLVVLDNDSILINSAFHSNCGGETCSSGDVWLSDYSYLKKVTDPYCLNSPNAVWTKSLPLSEWRSYLAGSGLKNPGVDPSVYNFSQLTRQKDYRIGSFSLPFIKIRSDLNLRSAFFSVIVKDNMVVLRGRGYGHGVGLCQEGAMVMASKGFRFNDIIRFYFSGVIITDIKNRKSEGAL
jgi:stage II sporulation protein D